MSLDSIPAVDADGHVQEPPDAWERLDHVFRPYAPRIAFDTLGRPRQFIGGEMKHYIPVPEGGWDIPEGGHDPKKRLEDMDRQGVARSILFPTMGLMFGGLGSSEIQVALCRAYNDWLYEYCGADRERLLGVAVVPQRDVAESVAEARRCVESLGFRSVMLRPNPINGRTLGHPGWDPLWQLMAELDVPLSVHEGTTQDLPQSGNDRFENFAMRHVCSHPHEQQIAAVELILGGVLERHPRLRVVFLESGCGWLPHWLERMDEHTDAWGHATPRLPLSPTQYFERQCFISADPNERMIESVASLVSDDVIVFASDYPHPDAIADNIVGHIADRDTLSDETKQKILYENANRLFGLRGRS
jgi:predicted TIM-barrel fold metal-dependent hydrolase